MASSPAVALFNLQLSSSNAALYTAPTGTWVQILRLLAANQDTAPHQVTFYLVPSGNSAVSAYITTPALTILPGNTYLGYNENGLILGPGDRIYGFADTSAVVNCFASGLLSTGS
jgi:hypothetical protein